MNNKLIAYFLLILCFAIYDTAIKHTIEFNVGLNIFFYVSLYSFILYIMHRAGKESRVKIIRYSINILSSVILLRLLLNLLGIGKTYSEYSNLVSNNFIDIATWTALVFLFVILLMWAISKRLRK